MHELQESGAKTPVLATSSDKFRAIINRELALFNETDAWSPKNTAVRSFLGSVVGIAPDDVLDVLKELNSLFSQRALEESLLTEMCKLNKS